METLWHRCFSVNFVKFLRTPFFTEHLWATASEIRLNTSILYIFKKTTAVSSHPFYKVFSWVIFNFGQLNVYFLIIIKSVKLNVYETSYSYAIMKIPRKVWILKIVRQFSAKSNRKKIKKKENRNVCHFPICQKEH